MICPNCHEEHGDGEELSRHLMDCTGHCSTEESQSLYVKGIFVNLKEISQNGGTE